MRIAQNFFWVLAIFLFSVSTFANEDFFEVKEVDSGIRKSLKLKLVYDRIGKPGEYEFFPKLMAKSENGEFSLPCWVHSEILAVPKKPEPGKKVSIRVSFLERTVACSQTLGETEWELEQFFVVIDQRKRQGQQTRYELSIDYEGSGKYFSKEQKVALIGKKDRGWAILKKKPGEKKPLPSPFSLVTYLESSVYELIGKKISWQGHKKTLKGRIVGYEVALDQELRARYIFRVQMDDGGFNRNRFIEKFAIAGENGLLKREEILDQTKSLLGLE